MADIKEEEGDQEDDEVPDDVSSETAEVDQPRDTELTRSLSKVHESEEIKHEKGSDDFTMDNINVSLSRGTGVEASPAASRNGAKMDSYHGSENKISELEYKDISQKFTRQRTMGGHEMHDYGNLDVQKQDQDR